MPSTIKPMSNLNIFLVKVFLTTVMTFQVNRGQFPWHEQGKKEYWPVSDLTPHSVLSRMVKEASARLYTSRLPVGPHGAGVTPVTPGAGSPLYRAQAKMARSAGDHKLPREEQVTWSPWRAESDDDDDRSRRSWSSRRPWPRRVRISRRPDHGGKVRTTEAAVTRWVPQVSLVSHWLMVFHILWSVCVLFVPSFFYVIQTMFEQCLAHDAAWLLSIEFEWAPAPENLQPIDSLARLRLRSQPPVWALSAQG